MIKCGAVACVAPLSRFSMAVNVDWLMDDPLFSDADIRVKSACLQALVDIGPLVKAVYPVKAVHGLSGVVFEMADPVSVYKPLFGEEAMAFFCWDMRSRDEYESDDACNDCIEEVSGFSITIKPSMDGIFLRRSFEIANVTESCGDFVLQERVDPLPEGVQEACISRVACAPGFGQLRTIAQREDFATGLLKDVGGILPHIGAICRGAESYFLWEILPKEARLLRDQGLSATKIAAKLGVSKAKVDRALEAESPSL